MTDVHTRAQRSYNMSRIKGKNTKPEVKFRKALWSEGHRFRKHYPIIGSPDIAFVSKKLAVFIDGCFWHGCTKDKTIPKTNRAFWIAKITCNRKRDRKQTKLLKKSGWKVLRIWEHELKHSPLGAIKKVKRRLEDN